MTLGLAGPRAPGIIDAPPRPLGSLPERVLLRAYGDPLARVEACACGSAIAAMDDAGAITAAVRAHQQTPVHRAWRDREGI